MEELPTPPRNYPQTAIDLGRLLGKIPPFLIPLIIKECQDLTLILASVTSNGIALAGITIQRRRQEDLHGRRIEAFNRGFRPSRVPLSLAPSRYFSSHATVLRQPVDRIDHSWTHGRDNDFDMVRMRNAKVVIIGCGSLGAPIAVTLAQAGVGSIVLVDPGQLKGANISRHPLGADDIGNNKAEALAAKLLLRFPHLTISAIPSSVQHMTGEGTEQFSNSVVVNATGDWAALVFLEVYLRALNCTTKFFTCWLEAHAAAGHAIFSPEENPPISSAFDSTGTSRVAVSVWPNTPVSREPACGAAFSPYGASDTLNSVSLAADLAIDLICDRVQAAEHRIWVGVISLELQDKEEHGGPIGDNILSFATKAVFWSERPTEVMGKDAGNRDQRWTADNRFCNWGHRVHDKQPATD